MVINHNFHIGKWNFTDTKSVYVSNANKLLTIKFWRIKMLKKFSLIINRYYSLRGLSCLFTGSLFPSSPENVRSVPVNGIGRVTIVPDMATVNIGVRTQAEVVTDALDGTQRKPTPFPGF
jgi:hypothetical protein